MERRRENMVQIQVPHSGQVGIKGGRVERGGKQNKTNRRARQ
jgi:hypothetical protein